MRRIIIARAEVCDDSHFSDLYILCVRSCDIWYAFRQVDLRDVGIVFGNRYGDGKTLAKWIKDDLSGDYEKLMLAVCGLD